MILEEYLNSLESKTKDVLKAIESCPAEMLSYKKDHETWSILEIAEHIYVTNKTIYTIVSQPCNEKADVKELIGEDKLKHILVEQRQQKVLSPDFLKPKGIFKTSSDFIMAFMELHHSIKNDLEANIIIIDNRIHNHFLLGKMTIRDWLSFMIHHMERHIQQIKDQIDNNN